jgi:hypothetical protein
MVGVMNAVELQRGEKQLGQYQVQIARSSKSGWVASIPPLAATVTNLRLILVPQTRKPHPPASIPGLYIVKIHSLVLSQRPAVLIRLRMGYDLNLFVGWGQSDDFARHLRALLIPPPPRGFLPILPEEDIVRMIEGISRL